MVFNPIPGCRAEELEKSRADLAADLAEQRRELEVSDNDKTVLRDSLKQAEGEKNGLALDLAETSKVCRAKLLSRKSDQSRPKKDRPRNTGKILE